MQTRIGLAFVVSAAALVACGNGSVPPVDSGPADSGTHADVAPADSPAACVSTQPAANASYCTMAGCPFRPVSMPSCTGAGGMYDFYGPDYCTATATIIIISAGWCVPCMQEAPMIESQLTQGYRPRGVRVINVYAQNPDASTPTINHCMGWVTGSERSPAQPALTSHVVMDPMGLTQQYLPTMGQGFPTTLVIDNNGNINDLIVGGDLGRIASDLDTILQAQGR